ncbi:MAG: C39 family peptidase [Thermodesulfobacteriota bacterium]|nr:C39 family peptidase [Thermodesulfobacteriota bacterium]
MKLEVPYFKQEKSTTCGPACIRMVLEYNGVRISEIELEDIFETSWLGNTCEELASGVEKLGLLSEVVENFTLESLKEIIERGIPIIALLDPAVLYGGVQGFGHFVTITGLEQNVIYYHDPDMGIELAKDVQLFFIAWKKFSLKGVTIWKSTKK